MEIYASQRKPTIFEAIGVFRESFEKDEGFREVYKSSIAMAFKDQVDRYKEEFKGTTLNEHDYHNDKLPRDSKPCELVRSAGHGEKSGTRPAHKLRSD